MATRGLGFKTKANSEGLSSLGNRSNHRVWQGLECVNFLSFVATHFPSSGPRTSHFSPGYVWSGRILPPCLGCELLKAKTLASLLWAPGTLPGSAECLTTGADLVSYVVSLKVVSLSCHGSGALDVAQMGMR